MLPHERIDLQGLYAENVVAKILQVAQRPAEGETAGLPDTVPQVGPKHGRYQYRDKFWTCGFFPGSLYLLLERIIRHPAHLGIPNVNTEHMQLALRRISQQWASKIEWMSERTDTHDLGFLIQPAFRKQWDLFRDEESLKVLHKAARSLASRNNGTLNAIRSWDKTANDRFAYSKENNDFLVIVDSMCNLDLLFFVGHQYKEQSLIDMATAHARTVQKFHVREDFSTFHLVNFDACTSDVRARVTVQGYDDGSTWARGQAWAILGFAQTFAWTQDHSFLRTAKGCADLLLQNLAACEGRHHHPYALPWDFDAPYASDGEPLRDSSAAMAAAVGLVHLHACLIGTPLAGSTQESPREDAYDGRFLDFAIRIAEETLDLCLDNDSASFTRDETQAVDIKVGVTDQNEAYSIHEGSFDAILRHATAQNCPHAFKRVADHGSVYADYFLLELGNLLLDLEKSGSK